MEGDSYYDENNNEDEYQEEEEKKQTEGNNESYQGNDEEEQDQVYQELDNTKEEGINALNLQWVLGFNKDIIQGVHNLTSANRTEIFYSAAHTGVIYNYESRTQKLLQGHCNRITCTACSLDKRWIVTADSGNDSMLVVWDSLTATPVKTIFTPHQDGVRSLDISPDSMYIVTISYKEPQSVSLWDWTSTEHENDPIATMLMPEEYQELQTCIRFNPNNVNEFSTNGKKRVVFWERIPENTEIPFHHYGPELAPGEFKPKIGSFTQTVFIPNSTQAVTATTDGDIVVWDISEIVDATSDPNNRRAIKVVQLNTSVPINVLTLHDKYLVTGSADGAIRFYDFRFIIVAWFENLDITDVMSISFADLDAKQSTLFDKDVKDVFSCADFIVTDDSSQVCMLWSSLFEEVDANKKKGEVLMKGLLSGINAVAVHPTEPILAIGGKVGFIQSWNYLTKRTQVNKYDFFEKEVLTCMDISADGKYLVVGFSNGTIRILDPIELTDKQAVPYKH